MSIPLGDGIITIICAIVGSGSAVAAVMHYRQNNRKRKLANDDTAIAQWRELYEKSENKSQSKSRKLEVKDRENANLRTKNSKYASQINWMKEAICHQTDCPDRTPPLGTNSKCVQCNKIDDI